MAPPKPPKSKKQRDERLMLPNITTKGKNIPHQKEGEMRQISK
jgi:hypothetical protein